MTFLKHVHHIAIICKDYQRSKHFYTHVLGLEIMHEAYRADRDSYKLDLALNGVYVIELFSFSGAQPRSSWPEAAGLRHLAFAVDSLAKTLNYFQSIHLAYEAPRVDEYTGKRFTFIFDPDDLPIEIYETGA